MAIFGNLELEKIIQVSDKTRLDAKKSFVSKDEAAITMVEIEPEAGNGFIDVSGSSSPLDSDDWFLDWEYSGATRTVTVSLRITTDGAPETFTETIEVITEADDKLFSGDQDIMALENNILRYVKPGRNTFKDFHRKSQTLILDWLNDLGVRTFEREKITKDNVVELDEVRKWSERMTLRLIFQSISNKVDDVFALKAAEYEKLEADARNRSEIRLDLNNDGTIDKNENQPLSSFKLSRT